MAARTDSRRLYEQVAQTLAARIADGDYRIGERLPSERDLALAFSVSRPTIREAIIALELDGLVEVKMGSGVYVIALAPAGGMAGATDIGPFELLEARRAIEGEACALAAVRITEDALARLRLLITEMADENDRDVVKSEDADRRFHLTIAEATQNSAMIQAVTSLWESRSRSPQHRFLSVRGREAGVKPAIAEHAAILEALSRKDPGAARAAMREHLTRVIEMLLDATATDTMEEARAQVDARRSRFMATPH